MENEIKEQEEVEAYSSADDDELFGSDPEPKKRGRPKIPSKWTNVLKLGEPHHFKYRVNDFFVDVSLLPQ